MIGKFANRQRQNYEELNKEYLQIVDIPLDSLEDNPYQPRINIDENKLQELMNSISENGLQSPIKVTKLGGISSPFYTVIYGHRRVEAHKRLGLKTIKAFYDPNISKQLLRKLALIENIQRDDLGVLELAISFDNAILDGTFSSQKELAKHLGFSEAKVSSCLNILKLDKNIIKDLEQDRTVKDINLLSALNKVEDKKKQYKLYKQFKENILNRDEILALINSKNSVNIKFNSQCELNLNKLKFSFLFKPNKTLSKSEAFQEYEDFAKEKLELLQKELEEKEKELLNQLKGD